MRRTDKRERSVLLDFFLVQSSRCMSGYVDGNEPDHGVGLQGLLRSPRLAVYLATLQRVFSDCGKLAASLW